MFDLPIRAAVHHGSPINPDMVVIAELEKFLSCKLRSIVRGDGVWYSKAMDDVEEKFHSLLGLDHRDRSSLDLLCELVNGDKQVCAASRRFPEGTDHIKSLDREWPCDGDYLECLSRQVGPPSIVLAPFASAHDPLGVDICYWPVEPLAESIPNQGSQSSLVPADPAVDVLQQPVALLDRNAAVYDPGVASLVKLPRG
jgi:hypothetical protein